jgi:hypothetical protein
MPSTVDAVFSAAELAPEGVVPWGTAVPQTDPGVYLVAFTRLAHAVALRNLPFQTSRDALRYLLDVRPELRIDQERPDVETLRERLEERWLGDEAIAYVGLAGTSLTKRVDAYYKTPLGARRPHAGGWPLKILSNLDEMYVHYAACADPDRAETTMLEAFRSATSPKSRRLLRDPDMAIPFANLELRKGQRKNHGITGAREPRRGPLAPRPPDQTEDRSRQVARPLSRERAAPPKIVGYLAG